MMEDELRKKIEEISASIGLDFEDENLSDEEKNALFRYALKEIDKEEFIDRINNPTTPYEEECLKVINKIESYLKEI